MGGLAGLESARLRLEAWASRHKVPVAEMLADPVVRRHFPSVLDEGQSAALMRHFAGIYDQHGVSFLPLVRRADDVTLGYLGLLPCDLDFGPDRSYAGFEIGWSLGRAYWRQGYATEMARDVLNYAERTMALSDIVAFTAVDNLASQGVMRRINMTPWGRFAHPKLATDHRLSAHVLFRKVF